MARQQQSPWNIIRVRTGRELVAHELFLKYGFEVYTPFETRRQLVKRKVKGQRPRHIHYAEPINSGYLFIRFDGSPPMLHKLCTLIDKKEYLYGAITHGEEFYSFASEAMEFYRNGLVELQRERKRLMPRGYDPQIDSRKNKQRIYGQYEPIEFKEDELVEFQNGLWSGITFRVTSTDTEFIKLETSMYGNAVKVEALPESLQKAS